MHLNVSLPYRITAGLREKVRERERRVREWGVEREREEREREGGRGRQRETERERETERGKKSTLPYLLLLHCHERTASLKHVQECSLHLVTGALRLIRLP